MPIKVWRFGFSILFLLSGLSGLFLLHGCVKNDRSEHESVTEADSIFYWYSLNAKIILPSEVLDTTRVRKIMEKPENDGLVFTSFQGVFALVRPIKWDGKSEIDGRIVYELTDSQYKELREKEIKNELNVFKERGEKSGFTGMRHQMLIEELSSLRDSVMNDNKTFIYHRGTHGGGGIIITSSRKDENSDQNNP